MTESLLVQVMAGFVLSLAATGCLRSFANRRALVDHPNARSLHTTPVPRLGGVAIVASALAVMVTRVVCGGVHRDLLILIVVAFLVSALGLLDDVRHLSAALRLLLQFGLATAFVLLMGPGRRLFVATDVSIQLPPFALAALEIVYLVGVLNVYNFLDGMDGLAGGQAVAAGVSLAAAFSLRGMGDLPACGLVLAAAAVGFLAHNYPPATVFMGDAGSTFLGFSFAALGLLGAMRDPGASVAIAPLALAPFLLDGAFTLLRRLLRGERVWEAHRTHLYQRAVATGLSHRSVLLPYAAWMAASSACAVAAAQAESLTVVVLAAVPVFGLGAVWFWVARRERARAV